MGDISKQVAGRIRVMCSRLLERAPSNIQALKSKGDWKTLGVYVHGACRNALRLGMLEIRQNNDLDSASTYFSAGATIAAELQFLPPEMLSLSNYDIPIFCCLISGDFQGAKSLAEIVNKSSIGNAKSHFDVHAKVLGAFVLSDKDQFRRSIENFENLEKNYWWEKQKIYFCLYESVMEKNQEKYDLLLNEASSLFEERAEDEKFGDQLGEYGGLGENDYVIDFMALGIASVAKSKGLDTSLDTKCFPLLILK